MGVPEPESRSALPALYESPWRVLGRSLTAVLASLRLSVRQLWRRNRQGDLPRPSFWPVAMAPLYWPLLGLLLGLLLTAGVVLGVPRLVARLSRSVEPPAPVSPAVAPAQQSAAEADRVPAQLPAQLPAQPEEPVPVEPDLPLLAELGIEDRWGLLADARAEPAAGQLILVLSAGWLGLEPAERQRQADAWQGRAQALGYERLCLEDGQGRLLARVARVGSGMILLAPSLPADVRGS